MDRSSESEPCTHRQPNAFYSLWTLFDPGREIIQAWVFRSGLDYNCPTTTLLLESQSRRRDFRGIVSTSGRTCLGPIDPSQLDLAQVSSRTTSGPFLHPSLPQEHRHPNYSLYCRKSSDFQIKMEDNRNNDSHDLILEAVKSIDSIQTRDTDFHGDGTPPNSPAGFVSGPTWLSPTDDPAERAPSYWQSHSWMFRLPGELRIKIFRELLVTTKVYISFTNCRLLMAQRGAKLKQRATRGVSEFDEKHVEYYGVLGDDNDGERADVGTYFSPRRCHDDWNEYAMRNIALQSPAKFRDSYHPRPHLNIFLACHRARDEAEDIFYSENCFTFCTCNQVYDYNAAWDISAAHAAYCFFQDRSRHALKEIKHIELHVMH